MPNDSSGSIEDLMGKRETKPGDKGNVSDVEEKKQPEAKPASEIQPKPTADTKIETLADEIAGKEAELQKEGEGPKARPANARIADDQLKKVAQKSTVVTAADLRNIKNLSQEDQVKVLTEMVMTDGLEKAIVVIKRLRNPYLYDLLHDTLVDELYNKLKGPKL